MSGSALPTTPLPIETKGSVVRSLAAILQEHRMLEGVNAVISTAARQMLKDPPIPTEWIDGRILNEILEAVHQIHGPDMLRKLQRQSIERGVSPLVRGAAESLLRMFGASPATLLSRMGRVGGTMSRGVTYHYAVVSATSGVFEIEYPRLVDVPLGPSIATVGALELVFEMCSVRGAFGPPEMVPNGRRNHVRFPVSWQGARDR